MTTWKPITQSADLPVLRDKVEESEFLDFKAEAWKAGDDGAREIARDVAQFANHLGGCIIVGAIEDEHNRLLDYQAVPDAATVAQRVTDVCHTWFFPRLEVHPTLLVTVDRKDALLVVNVEPFDGVVAIKPRGKDYYEFYRRYGKGKKPISFEEVERMWTDGRKGRLLLAKIPERDLSQIRVDAEDQPGVHLSGQFAIIRREEYFTIALSIPGPTVNLPYECVRAVWPSAGGGWSVSLAVRFEIDAGGQLRAKYLGH